MTLKKFAYKNGYQLSGSDNVKEKIDEEGFKQFLESIDLTEEEKAEFDKRS